MKTLPLRRRKYLPLALQLSNLLLIDQDDISCFMHYLERLEHKADQVLFRQGDVPNGLFFIEHGQVDILLELENGQQKRFYTLDIGTIFGKMELYEDSPRSASVVTNKPCTLYHLSKSALQTMQTQDPELSKYVPSVFSAIAERSLEKIHPRTTESSSIGHLHIMTKIVSIHSFRGGTGKSNVVANLTASLALQGLRVGVIDTDIQSPGIHVLFGLNLNTVKLTLNDYLQGRCSIEQTAYDVGQSLPDGADQIAAAGGTIYLIPSSMKANEITTILSQGYDIRLLTSGYEELSKKLKLDFLMIDTHPGVNEETLLSIGISHVLIVILRPDYQDYQGTAVTVNVAKKLDIPKMFLLVNRVLADFDVHDIRKQMEATYQIPVAGVLQDHSELARLGSRQIFRLCYPDHPLSKEFSAIATLIKR